MNSFVEDLVQDESQPCSAPRIMICGRGYSTNLCMARAFGKAGYDVEILRTFKRKPRKKELLKLLKPDAYSKYVKAFHICVTNDLKIRLQRRLIKLADENQKMLLIPTDDLSASIS